MDTSSSAPEITRPPRLKTLQSAIAVREGLGVALMPNWLIGLDIKQGNLEMIFGEYTVSPTALDTNIYAVFPHNRHLSPKVRTFIDMLIEEFQASPPWE